MKNNKGYLYTFACHEDERELCELELLCLLGVTPGERYVESGIRMLPSRSPFVHERLEIAYEAASLTELEKLLQGFEAGEGTFKLIYLDADVSETYEEKRAIERRLGAVITGKAEMKQPDRLFGVAFAGGRWVFGEAVKGEAVWLKHNARPRQYSTALSTRVARAAVNIAAPGGSGTRLLDPCCGIGTVLVEACSMGIEASGCDINPLAVTGARENLRHFGLPEAVKLMDMRELTGEYDTLVLDLPYNLCSVMSGEQLSEMLQQARRLAGRAVILTTEEIEDEILHAGFAIITSCRIHKGRFFRKLLLCS